MATCHGLCIIMLGESGVGKTSLLKQFCKNTFDEEHKSTIDPEFYSKKINLRDATIELKLWDTAGQERFRSITKKYFRQADGVLMVYDMTRHSTFMELSSWLNFLRLENEEATVVIVGNKTDLRHLNQVSATTVEEFAREEELEFYETSAKDNENIDEVFEKLALKVLERKKIAPFYRGVSNGSTEVNRLGNTVSTSVQTDTDLIICVVADVEPVKKKKNCC